MQGRFYAIFVVERGELEVHRLDESKYRRLQPDERGHYLIEPLGAKLGVWYGLYFNETAPWLRWYDTEGTLLPIAEERADDERRRADQERHRAEQLAEKLRELGLDPDAL